MLSPVVLLVFCTSTRLDVFFYSLTVFLLPQHLMTHLSDYISLDKNMTSEVLEAFPVCYLAPLCIKSVKKKKKAK